MHSITEAPFITEITRICTNMYSLGWDERNAGNISVLLDEEEITPYLDKDRILRTVPTGFKVPSLAGKYFLCTAAGKYFKNTQYDAALNLGIFRILEDGETAGILWGYSDGGQFTSELPAHLMSHVSRLSVDQKNRVILHCHPLNLIAMTYVHSLDEREFSRTLWKMETECVFVFPDGVRVIPWMVCGTNKIGEATAEKMKLSRIVVWPHHGIYGAGRSIDDAFGLVETVEKAAAVYLKIAHLPIKQTLTDENLHMLEKRFNVKTPEGWLEP